MKPNCAPVLQASYPRPLPIMKNMAQSIRNMLAQVDVLRAVKLGSYVNLALKVLV